MVLVQWLASIVCLEGCRHALIWLHCSIWWVSWPDSREGQETAMLINLAFGCTQATLGLVCRRYLELRLMLERQCPERMPVLDLKAATVLGCERPAISARRYQE